MPRRYTLNNRSQPSGSVNNTGGTTNTTQTTSSTASINTAVPGILLGMGGSWLVARMFLFGGALWLLEIVAIVVISGVAHSKGGKGQKVTAKIIIGLAVLNLFIPGFNSWVKEIRDNQLNPSPPEQSTYQQEQVPPAPVEEEIDKRAILPRTNTPIYIKKSGQYKVKPGKYRLCFSWLGDETGYYNQGLRIDNEEFISNGLNCFQKNISSNIINVEFINPPQTEVDTYIMTRNKKGGQGLYPFLEKTE
jgi:hypothetical protein